jgi:nucleoid-associated protein YgaU
MLRAINIKQFLLAILAILGLCVTVSLATANASSAAEMTSQKVAATSVVNNDGGGGNNWEAVKDCESRGNGGWSADTGNGYYGGLQVKLSTWYANGGTGNPAEASSAEQIAVAKNILATQGAGAWPNCGKYLSSGTTDVQTAPEQQNPQQPEQNNVPSQQPQWGQQHHQYSSSHHCSGTYTVVSGDTLSQIAAEHGTTWQHLYQQNQNVIGGSPDDILPGQTLQL